MKHSRKITLILIAMFFLTQLIGLFVVGHYSPEVKEVPGANGTMVNITSYNLPYGYDPPENQPGMNLISIITAIGIAVAVMFLLMWIKAESFLRGWFFVVVVIALGITFNSLFPRTDFSSLLALMAALPLAFFKIYKRNIIVHNATELAIYPGIAAIIVPLLNMTTIVILLIVISVYDMYAVWHAGFMQKMAKYQMEKLKVFSGFFIPYLGVKEREMIAKSRKNKRLNKKIKVNVAILGGGDVVFPIILAGIVLQTWGFLPALIISIGATIALSLLFYFSEKGKFYPAMPFISLGCFAALLIAAAIR